MVHDYKTYSDDQLLRLVQADDEFAFKEIFERYWRKLYAIAYNRIQTTHSAEDIVQEVLTMLWIRRADLEINSLNNYLSTAVRYNIFHEFRKNNQRNKLEDSLKFLNQNQSTATIEEELRFKVIQQNLQSEINKLPEKCKLVFRYSRELGMSNKEIAQQLQLSGKTVEAHITRALRHLRAALKRTSSLFFTVFF
jgi:RNA polymerase sigma-70 factor (ECF subfamily)